nr:HU family DNA-binding protein [Phocaeicola faecicola]
MEKLVAYSVVPRFNPAEKERKIRYYAQAQARGVMGIREMADRIQKMCTVTRTDTLAVLTALVDVMCDGLAQGEVVRLGELGAFQVGLKGKGSETVKGFHTGLISKAHINFRPGAELRNALQKLGFMRVPKRKDLAELGPKMDGKEAAEQPAVTEGRVVTEGPAVTEGPGAGERSEEMGD